jgi:hypothetical protein
MLIVISTCMHAGWNFFGKKAFPSSKMFLIAQFSGIVLLLPFVIIKFDLLGAIPPNVWLQVTAAGFFVMLITILLGGQGEQISVQAVTGIMLVGIAAFFLPMKRWGGLSFPEVL